ncbi:hypothetical protein MRX96_015918 [Rhipicephalus microplus]
MDNQQQMARCPAAMDSEAVTYNTRCGVRGLSIREDLHHKENGINAIFNVLNPFDEHMISLLEEYPNYSVRRPARVLPL